VPPQGPASEADLAIQKVVADAAAAADAAVERLAIHDSLSAIWTIVDELNGYITDMAPWQLSKDDANRERLGTVLYTAAEGLRALAVLLHPIMPQATEKLWTALGHRDVLGELSAQPVREAATWGQLAAGTSVNGLEPLFPRIETPAA
jgi:methionyl-tRNA synthetase